MKLAWWKILSILIILYVIFAGLLVPLKQGITAVSPSSLVAGSSMDLKIIGYNTTFNPSHKIRVWLKQDDDHALECNKVVVVNETELNASFSIPHDLPFDSKVKDFTLVVDNAIEGTTVLPNAIYITKNDSIKGDYVNAKIENLTKATGFTFPFRNILAETIRNTYFHVPLWFAMFALFFTALLNSVKFLRTNDLTYDFKAAGFTYIGLIFGFLGLITGAIWAKHTWGAYWSWDVKQNMAAISVLIYLAYFVLKNSFEDREKGARLSGVYNIFAFMAMIPLLFVIPRMTDSLHPGNGGNPAIGSQDLDNTMRMVFYPAIIGFILFGFWLAQLKYRYEILNAKVIEDSNEG